MLFGVLFEVLVMVRQVLFWGGALQAVLLEVLACNRWMVFRYLGSMQV